MFDKSSFEVMKPNELLKHFPKGKKKTYSNVENCVNFFKLHAGMFSGYFSLLCLLSSSFFFFFRCEWIASSPIVGWVLTCSACVLE